MSANARFTTGVGQDKTLRTVTQDVQIPAYAATMVITPLEQYTLFAPAQLNGALALSAGVGTATSAPYVGDVIEMVFTSTPGSTITFGAGFLVTAATLIIPAGKGATARFQFNGASWAEQARAISI